VRLAVAVIPLLGALMVAGCGGTAPAHRNLPAAPAQATYVVRPGDTLYHIASHFGVSVSALMSANGISNPRDLRVGQTLLIPGSYRAARPAYAGRSRAFPYHGARADRQFAWPVSDGVVSSGFGVRNGAMHEGIDIAAPEGTPVRAADGGVVIFCGQLHGYGNTVIISHGDEYATVYAHDEVNFVKEGTRVSRGETIGRIGTSGRTTGANLHFEVRHDNVARNPLAYLPEPPAAPGITYAEQGGS
jgi:murein DD-endopeptidase MepM/ murein hydrolase activator NlpD